MIYLFVCLFIYSPLCLGVRACAALEVVVSHQTLWPRLNPKSPKPECGSRVPVYFIISWRTQNLVECLGLEIQLSSEGLKRQSTRLTRALCICVYVCLYVHIHMYIHIYKRKACLPDNSYNTSPTHPYNVYKILHYIYLQYLVPVW